MRQRTGVGQTHSRKHPARPLSQCTHHPATPTRAGRWSQNRFKSMRCRRSSSMASPKHSLSIKFLAEARVRARGATVSRLPRGICQQRQQVFTPTHARGSRGQCTHISIPHRHLGLSTRARRPTKRTREHTRERGGGERGCGCSCCKCGNEYQCWGMEKGRGEAEKLGEWQEEESGRGCGLGGTHVLGVHTHTRLAP